MKNKDLKKGKESTIGKIIYGFLLFMPLLAILSTILVNTFNKEVTQPTQEAEITYKYETNEVNNANDLIVGNVYHFHYDGFNNPEYYLTSLLDDNDFYFAMFNINVFNPFQMTGFDIDEVYFEENQDDNYPVLNLFENGWYLYSPTYHSYIATTNDTLVDADNQSYDFDFIYIESNISNYNANFSYFFSICENVPIESVEITTQDTSVNDIFYYAVDKVENSNLFNWATNSLIYTGIANTCTQLSITTTFIPLLLAYWLIISVIYILYDIILMILIILHNKVHRLQDSI